MNTKTAHKHLELTTKALTLLAKLKASEYVSKMTKRVKATIKRLKAVLRKSKGTQTTSNPQRGYNVDLSGANLRGADLRGTEVVLLKPSSKALPVSMHQDPHNPAKVWYVKRSKHGHYFLNHAIDGCMTSTRYTRTTIKHIKSLGITL